MLKSCYQSICQFRFYDEFDAIINKIHNLIGIVINFNFS